MSRVARLGEIAAKSARIAPLVPSPVARALTASAGRTRSALRYRADVDGLRAVAVVSVVLFHADFAAFSGGFVGVDVFFVISGYLITSIILDDIDAGRFSVLSFYERRIRRIFPALFATLLASLVIGVFVLLPSDLRDLGQSITAATLFASNVLFWQEAGYFDSPAERKPLLHTWSLAVEEQFYVVFPLLLLLLSWAGRGYVRTIVLALLFSFALSVWGVRHAPEAAFYLAPLRAWELLLGALLAMGAIPSPGRPGVRDGLSLLGLGLIACSVFAFSPQTPFPGVSALLPCLGAALVIHAGVGSRSLAGCLLSVRPVVFTGLISYSLYLWHWPLLVFADYYAIRELTVAETLAVLALAVPVSAASWRYVETPFRRRRPVLARPQLFAAAGIVMGAAVVAGLGLHLTHGLPFRLPPEAARLAEGAGDRHPNRGECLYLPPEAVRNGRVCRIGAGEQAQPTFVLWGDSHAEMLKSAVGRVAAQAGRSGLFAGYPGCPPLLDVNVESPNTVVPQGCRAFNQAFFETAARDGIDTVILAAHWSLYTTGRRYGREAEHEVYLGDEQAEPWSVEANEAVFRRSLERTVAALTGAGKEVVIVAPVPEVESLVPSTLALAAWFGHDVDIRPARDSFAARNRIVLSALAELSGHPRVRVVYPHAVLCNDARCRVERAGRALYADDNHLSVYGAGTIRHLFEEVLSAPPASSARAEGQ